MRDQLSQKIDLSASRIKPYEGFIFLCGGPTDVKSPLPISIRDAIYRELVKDPQIDARIRIAEDYKDWSHDSIYRDLVSFESHLAELSSVIVLSLESAGSIAELGLFSVINAFHDKLLVFIESSHYQSPSFIKFGPIDYLEKAHNNNANCQKWLKKQNGQWIFDPDAASQLQAEMAEAILERIRKPTKERQYQSTGWLDNALLMCDLISLNSALTVREIRDLFNKFSIAKTESEVRQTLFLLEKVDLVAMEPKGDQRFFVCRDARQFLQFHLHDAHFDLNRFRSDMLAEYEKNDKKRFRAIQESRKKYA